MISTSMALIRYRPRPAREDATAWLGLLIFLGSWSMMFATLFAVYAALRVHAPEWPPGDLPRLPLFLPAVNTVVLGLSSVAFALALRAARRGRRDEVTPALVVAAVLGALFVVGQTWVWVGLWRAGLRPDGGPFPSVFYALTAFHALHVLVGLGGLASLFPRAFKRAFGPSDSAGLRRWAAYWHFVDAVWILMFVSIFVF
jgi:cytochrome c oxidase subunit 3